MKRSARLILWDIDGTLVDSARLGREAFADAFVSVFGLSPAGLVSLNGRTDHEIALDLLRENEIENPQRHLEEFSSALAQSLAGKAELIRARGHAHRGAHVALERLAGEPEIVQSVLTGNIEPNAVLKLEIFSLADHLDLEVGAYGSDHAMRAELVGIARRKAQAKYGERFPPAKTVVIGDTPLDVAAGRSAGARVVGIASGPFSERELSDAGADAVLPDLTDVGALLSAVTAQNGRR